MKTPDRKLLLKAVGYFFSWIAVPWLLANAFIADSPLCNFLPLQRTIRPRFRVAVWPSTVCPIVQFPGPALGWETG